MWEKCVVVCFGGLDASIPETLDLVDPDQPVFRGVSFFKHVQLKVFVPDLCTSHTVVARGFSFKHTQMLPCSNLSLVSSFRLKVNGYFIMLTLE